MKNRKKIKLKKISIWVILLAFMLSDFGTMAAMASEAGIGTESQNEQEKQEDTNKEDTDKGDEDQTNTNELDTNKDNEKQDETKDKETDNENTSKEDEKQDNTNKEEPDKENTDKEENQDHINNEDTDKENKQEDTNKEDTDKENKQDGTNKDETDKENNTKKDEDKKAGMKKALLEAPAIKVSVIPTENGEGMTDIVLKGTSVGGASTDIPVYCIRKGTDEGKHYSMFFAGEGFSADEQDSFIYDVKEKTELFLKTNPMNYFAEKFDVYAALVPSEGRVNMWQDPMRRFSV